MKKLNATQEEVIVFGLDRVQEVAGRLYQRLPICRVMTFTGPLGAGKTTLIRELLNSCGVQEQITSPTFNYLNIYTNVQGYQFFHFDLYRITSLSEFCAAGFDEYLYMPNSWAFIEWPEHIMPLLDNAVCHVALEYDGEQRQAKVLCK